MTDPAGTPRLGTFDLLAAHLATALSPLTEAVTDLTRFRGLMLRLGWDVTELPQPYVDLGEQVQTLIAGVSQLRDDPTPARALEVLTTVGEAYEAMRALPPPPGAADPRFGDEIGERLFELLLGDHLTRELPVASALLELLGVAVFEPQPADDGRPGHERLRLAWDELPDVLADPAGRVQRRYGWGDAGFEPRAVMEEVLALVAGAGVLVGMGDADPAVAAGYRTGEEQDAPRIATALQVHVATIAAGADRHPAGFDVLALPGSAGAAPGLLLQPNLPGDIGPGFALGEHWELQVDGATDPARPVGLVVRPGELSLRGAFDPGDGLPPGGLVATLASSGLEPAVLLGSAGHTRLEVGGVAVATSLTEAAGEPQLGATVELDDVAVVVSTADLGAFLGKLTGDAELRASFGFALTWTAGEGLSVAADGGFAVTLFPGLTLGPVSVDVVELGLRGASAPASAITADARVNMSGSLPMLSFDVERFGVALVVGLAGGNAGPMDIGVAFLPPEGVGCRIDAGVAAGGGYLDLDPEGGYAGVLEVDVLAVGICAVALLDTDAPEVSGWSLLLALFIDLPVIQLGFGFTLTGLGGLAGINRTIDTSALEAAVRSGSLDTVLFPEHPVDDAPIVIAELAALFPPCDGRYVFGPVARLGWGTPTLIEAELGLVLALPDPVTVVVLGTVSSILPTAETDLVAMHLDVAGVVDTAAGTLAIDASLHDSHIGGFALAGDMAVRAGFVDQPSFLMALGGFHPGFEAPDDFPDLRPLSLAISAAPVLHVSFECYTAITSNSVQFGSAFNLWADVAGFRIEGGAFFDALIEFSPFLLSTRLGWYVAVSAVGVDLLGVWLEASVDGPNPWHIVGTARFKILGFEEHVRVDERIGTSQAEPAAEPADPLAELSAALADEGAWSTVASPSPGVVVTGAAPGPDELVVVPDGVVAVGQRAVPLAVRLDKWGDAPLGEHDTFTVEPGAASLDSTGVVQDWFAPGHYFELATGERLSAPSFERMQAGIEFGGGEAIAGGARPCTLGFEEILRDPEMGEESVALGEADMGEDERDLIMTASAGGAAMGGLQIAADEDPVALQSASFAVVNRNTGVVQARAGSWSVAHQSEAGRRITTVIVPSWEAPP